jgi:hypothetical protein
MSLPDLARILEIGAGIKTPLGLLGFVFGSLFLALLLWRPWKQAGRHGKMTAASWRRLNSILGLAAGFFLIALAIVSFAPTPPPAQPVPPVSPTTVPKASTAEERLKGYLDDFYILDSIFEAKDPGWPEQVRKEAKRLAELFGRENPAELRPARKILQPEYRGWALSMIARSYVETTLTATQRSGLQIESATQAIQEFDKAIEAMNDIIYRVKHSSGDKDAIDVYNWMMGASDDFKRTHYLKAVCIAVIAQAGGTRTKRDVRDELKNLPADYYLIDHPLNPYLNWALQD